MTDQEINIALAKAIGWAEDEITDTPKVHVRTANWGWPWSKWTTFDYRDPAVIWPIAAHFGSFPYSLYGGPWYAHRRGEGISAGTPELAVALAVIGGGT